MRYFSDVNNKSYIGIYCYKEINKWFMNYYHFDDSWNRWAENKSVRDLQFGTEEAALKFMGVSYKEIHGLEELNDYRRTFTMMRELTS